MKTAIEMAQELQDTGSWCCSCHKSFVDHVAGIVEKDGDPIAKSFICGLKNNLLESQLKIQYEILLKMKNDG